MWASIMRDMVTMSDLSLCSDWRGGRKWEAGRVGRHLGERKRGWASISKGDCHHV